MSADPVFQGKRDADGRCTVTYDGRPLPPRNDLRNHSPDGFNWGYGGSGPAQLALAILAAALELDHAAEALYQEFKWAFVCRWKGDTFTTTREEVIDWVLKSPVRVGKLSPPED